MEQLTITAQSFIQRHIDRISRRRLGLAEAHDFIMHKMALLNNTLTLLQKTHGFLKCRFNGFLKATIQGIKKRIARLKNRCRVVLKQIDQLDAMSLAPFAG